MDFKQGISVSIFFTVIEGFFKNFDFIMDHCKLHDVEFDYILWDINSESISFIDSKDTVIITFAF